jgi:hypothetical protein
MYYNNDIVTTTSASVTISSSTSDYYYVYDNGNDKYKFIIEPIKTKDDNHLPDELFEI